jgi:hypothetical protein
VAQEAAVLFSAGNTDGAVRILKAEIKDPAGKGNKQAWLMLFDLYQIQPNREEFDALSMLFTVKFEQSPPAWVDNADLSTDPRQSQAKERKDLYAFKGARSWRAKSRNSARSPRRRDRCASTSARSRRSARPRRRSSRRR